jgi:hypothetical protein
MLCIVFEVASNDITSHNTSSLRAEQHLQQLSRHGPLLHSTVLRSATSAAVVQVALEERKLIQERENVLCDLMSTQACVMEQLQKHWSWLYGIPPEETHQAGAESPSELAPHLHQNQYRQHTCVRLVEAATPQLLQQVLAMTTQDW